MDLNQLVDILAYKREFINQVPTVSTLLAVLAMSVVAVLITVPERGRLRQTLLIVLTAATLIFMLATILDACILPAMKSPAAMRSVRAVQGLLNLAEVVIWMVLVGMLMLFGAIGSIGFLYSRRAGMWIAGAAAGGLAIFGVCCFYLAVSLRP